MAVDGKALGSAGESAPGGGGGLLEADRRVAREWREVGSGGHPECCSEMGVQGSDLDRVWHSVGVVRVLRWYRTGMCTSCASVRLVRR